MVHALSLGLHGSHGGAGLHGFHGWHGLHALHHLHGLHCLLGFHGLVGLHLSLPGLVVGPSKGFVADVVVSWVVAPAWKQHHVESKKVVAQVYLGKMLYGLKLPLGIDLVLENHLHGASPMACHPSWLRPLGPPGAWLAPAKQDVN